MGINFSFLVFFDLCYEQKAFLDPMLALGSLEIHESTDRIRKYAEQESYPNLARDLTVCSLFRDRYSVSDYRDCDLNEQANIKLDLNKPLDVGMRDTFGTILNAGTVEHVFDIAKTITNIHDMARSGGTIIHLAPISWYEHGYYNINPRLLAAVAKTNEYSLLTEAFWFPDDVLKSQSDFSPDSDVQSTIPTLYITFDGHKLTPQRESISLIFARNLIPANALYMVAYRKNRNKAFTFPYDVCD